MQTDQITGIVRAVVPALVAYLVGKGWIPAGSAADIGALILAALAAGWSVASNTKSAKTASVAAMPGTVVSPDGKTITLIDRDLVVAAKDAATPASGVRP